ncbi:MAG: histidine phosphatase family protein [Nitrospira sp.]|nr:histidine phosphatase family protein [Nitrospira sp.]
MDCLLMRHGIAVYAEEWAGAEEDRPLTKKGKVRARQAAAGLAALKCRPTHLFSSPFVRAYDTAKLVRDEVCPTLKVERCHELAVGASPKQVLSFLRSLPPTSTVICVGHEPLLGEVAGILLGVRPLPGLSFKKAGAALIHLPDGPKPGRGILRWWLQPRQLRALAGC